MPTRYRAALALTLALTASLPAGARTMQPHKRFSRPAGVAASCVSADDLYSRRALRRARIILELKVMELRSEHLERIRKALQKHVPIEQLLKDRS